MEVPLTRTRRQFSGRRTRRREALTRRERARPVRSSGEGDFTKHVNCGASEQCQGEGLPNRHGERVDVDLRVDAQSCPQAPRLSQGPNLTVVHFTAAATSANLEIVPVQRFTISDVWFPARRAGEECEAPATAASAARPRKEVKEVESEALICRRDWSAVEPRKGQVEMRKRESGSRRVLHVATGQAGSRHRDTASDR